LIVTKNLSIKYGKNIIGFPDINLEQGNQLLITGKSGSGKTSFLNLLGGLVNPFSGTIKINNEEIGLLSKKKLDRFRGKNIGFVFQTPHFIKSLNVQDNLFLNQFLVGFQDKNQIEELLSKVNLKAKRYANINYLSEGEKQRVSIIRALVNRPKIVFADEPTSALDDESCNSVIELLKSLSKETNSTLVIVTHDHRLKSRFKKHILLDVN
tara:strand:+ start:1048 stop:1677 length:630 start_codon:yes stop_codon:yes gene_type:complete